MLAVANDPMGQFEARLRRMPPVRAMQVSIDAYDGERLRLGAPLVANVNDKGCAFGGSLAGLMTLSAWGLASLRLLEVGRADAEVFVQDSQLRYLAPLYEDLTAEARLATDGGWSAFLEAFRLRGKARAHLLATVRTGDGREAASFEGRFVALRTGAVQR